MVHGQQEVVKRLRERLVAIVVEGAEHERELLAVWVELEANADLFVEDGGCEVDGACLRQADLPALDAEPDFIDGAS